MNEFEVKQETEVFVGSGEIQREPAAAAEENGAGSDQEIVVGIDEDHINFLTSMASGGDDDSLPEGGPPEVDGGTGGARVPGLGQHDDFDDGDDDEDVMAAAESILLKTAAKRSVPQQFYQCQYCSKTFTWLKSLTVHLRTHTNVKPYKCELCDRSFVRSDYLKYHMLKSHETTDQVFTCTACSGVFATNRGLLRHIRTEHDGLELPPNSEFPSDAESYTELDENGKYPCTYCDEAFDAPSPLSQHMKRHLGDKPFRCDLCPKSFIRQDFLQCHRSNHLKDMDYSSTSQNGYPHQQEEPSSKRPRISLKKLEDLVPSNEMSRAETSEEEPELEEEPTSEPEQKPTVAALVEASDEQRSLLARLLTQVSRMDTAGDERLQCPQCEKTFSQDAALKLHLVTHAGELRVIN